MSVWDFTGKRAVIVGCYSGMGEAAARELVRLGAELHGFDIRPSPVELASFSTVDLKSPAAIDAAVKGLTGDIDLLFNCSGLPGSTFSAADVMKVNFSGMRHWTEQWLPRIRKGGAIATISSTAGFAYLQKMPTLMELIGTPNFDAASAWVDANPDIVGEGYALSKEAISVWTMLMGTKTIQQGVRINCICPGPTQTPMMGEFEKAAGPKVIDVFTLPIDRRSTPAEQAYPLIFLNSDAASFVNGHVLNVDGGFVGGVLTGQIDIRSSVAQAMGG